MLEEIISDSSLLIGKNVNDLDEFKDIIKRIIPIYKIKYPRCIETNAPILIKLINDFYYLDSLKLIDLLILLYYFPNKDDILPLLNENIIFKYKSIIHKDTMIKTIIMTGTLNLLKWKKHVFTRLELVWILYNAPKEKIQYLFNSEECNRLFTDVYIHEMIQFKNYFPFSRNYSLPELKNYNQCLLNVDKLMSYELNNDINVVNDIFDDGMSYINPGDRSIKKVHFTLFKYACYNDNLEFAILLWKHIHDKVDEFDLNQLFRTVCEYENIDIVKWMFYNKIGIEIDFNDLFIKLCEREQLTIPKWIWKQYLKSNIDIDISFKKLFSAVEISSETEKWLLKICFENGFIIE